MDVVTTFQLLGISLGLGLLVGTQRERVDAPLAGVRTFALIALLGTLTGLLALRLGAWIVVAGLLGMAAITAMGGILSLKQGRADAGITTEVAILLMYSIGVYLVFGPPQVAVVLGGGIAVLLHAKPVMHGFVKRLGESDMRIMMQFVLITLVILPVLPDATYGPFQVLNPRDIWRMVVLVVGISLAGYVAFKLYGARASVVVTGLIGGMISSTATTVSHARQVSRSPEQIAAATFVIMLASTVVYVRVLFEIFAVARRSSHLMAPPIAIMLTAAILVCAILGWKNRRLEAETASHQNPTELKSAIVFAALYGLILLVVAASLHQFGDRGLYIAAALSGLTDMDAITLTAARMSATGAVAADLAWRAIAIASISNLIFKAILVGLLGGSRLLRRIAVPFAVVIAVSLGTIVLWPQ